MEITASRNLKNFSSEFSLLLDSLTSKASFYLSSVCLWRKGANTILKLT